MQLPKRSNETNETFQEALRLHVAGELNNACLAYEACLEDNPKDAKALGNLGSIYSQQGDRAKARYYLEQSIANDPHDPVVYYNLGNLDAREGRYPEAIANYHSSLVLEGNSGQQAQTAYNLGLVLRQIGEIDAAEQAYRHALAYQPRHYEARLNLGAVLTEQGKIAEVYEIYQTLIKERPQDGRVINNLANLYQDQGEIETALGILEEAISKEPDRPQPRSNRLMTLQYKPGVSNAELKTTACDWGNWAMERATQLLGQVPTRRFVVKKAETPLRIGYVSADFSMHPVGLFLQDIIALHNPDKITPVLYSNGSLQDEVTARMIAACQQKGGGFREVKDLNDKTFAKQVQADEIDLLVDLSGHTGKSRLAMFAFRPASVQVSWLGYFATTGLSAIDYFIADPYQAPPGSEDQFTECVYRLPHNRFCYQPVTFAPDVSPPPCQNQGTIMFGSFNNTAKLNMEVLDCWAEILTRVPDSRLLLKWRTFVDGTYCARTLAFFSNRGIAAERIEMRSMSVHRELLEQYADIDIALDPFPFSGGQTSCETLWMGVPIITWPQERLVSRQTLSFLANIGMTQWVAEDRESYVAKAVALAKTPELLIEYRRTLRKRLLESPLCNVAQFTQDLETAYREMWNQKRLELAMASAKRGIELRHVGANVDERVACYLQATTLAPEIGLYAANLASAYAEAGDFPKAEQHARHGVAQNPERYETWYNLGIALTGMDKISEAAYALSEAAKRVEAGNPEFPDPASPLVSIMQAAGNAWNKGRDPVKALACIKAALTAHGAEPSVKRAKLLSMVGETYQALYQFPQAKQAYEEALEITPEDTGLLTDIGNVLCAEKCFDAARPYYEQVLAKEDSLASAWSNLGTAYQGLGDNDLAIRYYQEALERESGHLIIWSNLAAAMTYSLQRSPADLKAALDEFDTVVARPLLDHRPYANDRHPHRRLRIGYVSPDFRRHAVAYFALPLIEHHDPEQVEVFCYHNHLQHDEWTQGFKARADHWRHVVALSDEALAEQIRQDRIDILVDLAGHTENNRLLVFARKPAPVQVTWMGYVTTTGLSAMDWRITHADADPPGCEAEYAERLYRLPGTMWCYRPLEGMPAVSPAPSLRKGYITFGSFNRFSKNGDKVLDAWARILTQVPASRLVACVPEGEIRQRMSHFFASRGVEPARIDVFAKLSHDEFWKLHAEVDIALDPFPFGGGTTTCETLWLGVPLITCTGKAGGDFAPRFASRMGYAFLNNISVPELATDTIESYIAAAVALANDMPRLNALRASLREKMAAAPLTDAQHFAREMETAYRSMWQAWCANQPVDQRQ